jgi:hypothetical protein
MQLLGLWAVAGTLLLSALVFAWVTIAAHPRATYLERRSRSRRQEDLVRLECADLDEEYRQLLKQ